MVARLKSLPRRLKAIAAFFGANRTGAIRASWVRAKSLSRRALGSRATARRLRRLGSSGCCRPTRLWNHQSETIPGRGGNPFSDGRRLMLIGVVQSLQRSTRFRDDAARVHSEMEAGRADGASDRARAFHRPLPAVRSPDARRGRPRRRSFHLREGRAKTGGGEGWADVWKKGFFAWEYKKKKRDLGKAIEQLTRYAAALENPPLHVACDTHLLPHRNRMDQRSPERSTNSSSTSSPTL